ncbi:hypothetical protein [Paeniglutamicibacter psychrophenolicus]|uniref:hypothetical protein n=1 Tax=Paeniglutamicibacter psychrophenolicus TaxID=257454 RepID=UPI00278298F8|nr:hypothetical protein [Paeniglutamicibacter psychrophenolicus]MDQ0095280.1 cbb3-type cytochrome oxidase subunit 1 [Paeniglutamicibacter psychrophenolicus]
MESSQHPSNPTPADKAADDIEVEVYAAPKFWPFMGIGALLGVIIAFASAFTGEESTDFSRAAVAGFLSVAFAFFGVLLAGIVFLVVDRITRKKARRALAVPMGDPEHR